MCVGWWLELYKICLSSVVLNPQQNCVHKEAQIAPWLCQPVVSGNSSDGCTAVCGRKVQNLVMQFLGFFLNRGCRVNLLQTSVAALQLVLRKLLAEQGPGCKAQSQHQIWKGGWSPAGRSCCCPGQRPVTQVVPENDCQRLWEQREADVCPFVSLLTSVALSLGWAQPSDQMCYLTLLLVWKKAVWEVPWHTGWAWAKQECLPRGSAWGESQLVPAVGDLKSHCIFFRTHTFWLQINEKIYFK